MTRSIKDMTDSEVRGQAFAEQFDAGTREIGAWIKADWANTAGKPRNAGPDSPAKVGGR